MNEKTLEQRVRAWLVMDWITEHPGNHDQDGWIGFYRGTERVDLPELVTADDVLSCDTTACFAGWTVLLSGRKIRIQYEFFTSVEGAGKVSACAAELLGLDETEARRLFYGSNDLGVIRDLLIKFYGPRPLVSA